MKRLRIVWSILLLAAVLLSACAPAAAPVAAISLKDGLGREVKLDKPAQKIVSLSPSNTEILFALGAGAQVIGRDDLSDTPAEAKKLPSVGGNMGKYNFEEIAKLKPDLVLATGINTPEQVKALENLNVTTFYLENPKDLDGLFKNLETVGALTGRTAEAKKLNESLAKRVKSVQDTLAKAASKPKVFYELDATNPAKPWTAGPGSFIDKMITLAGGQNAAGGLKSEWAEISQEELIVQNPDVILLGDAAYGVSPEQVASRPGWSGIKAVKEKRILAFDDNLVSRPGPRLVDGYEAMAKAIHPELFK